MRARVGDWIALWFFVVIVYVLVRPSSKAAQLVAALGKFGRALISSAVGAPK